MLIMKTHNVTSRRGDIKHKYLLKMTNVYKMVLVEINIFEGDIFNYYKYMGLFL